MVDMKDDSTEDGGSGIVTPCIEGGGVRRADGPEKVPPANQGSAGGRGSHIAGRAAARRPAFLASRLRDLLEARGWTQSDLAEAAGIGRVAVSRYVNGRREPRAETVAVIASALGVNPADLVGEWGYIDDRAGESIDRAVDLVIAHIDELSLRQREAIALALARCGADRGR